MQIAFLMDRLDSINPILETTSHLMYECNERGHAVFFLEPHDVYIRGKEVVARMHNISAPRGLSMSFCRMGSTKAAVLPVPVWACPITSQPSNTCGIT